MKIGIIVDDMRLARWQADALGTLDERDELIIYNCTNTRASRRLLRHALYYMINLFTVRNKMTRRVDLTDVSARIRSKHEFTSNYEGSWQNLPQGILDQIAEDDPAVLLKFGMNLLRIPPSENMSAPILSYHHGDPDHYRGRPAGFYEILHGRPLMGQIVQILSNQLDAGTVVAVAETRIFNHSYRSTLVEAYSRSPLLLRAAIAAAVEGRSIPKACRGRAYKLPRNLLVIRFMLVTFCAAVARLFYGAFIEKGWRVSTAMSGDLHPDECGRFRLPPSHTWETFRTPTGYRFLADPFPAPDKGGLLAEAFSARRAQGDIVRLHDDRTCVVQSGPGHYSYPASFDEGGATYVIPETATWCAPTIYLLRGDRLEYVSRLNIEGEPRLLDPTFVRQGENVYLFANDAQDGGGVLRLWVARGLLERFEEHPCSPVRISPRGSRMAGHILAKEGALFRFGQDGSSSYGNGALIFDIEALTPTKYAERETGYLRLDDVCGPHTLNFSNGEVIFDWYTNRLSLFAGVRRLRERLGYSSSSG
jgi:hypothetical protein